MANSNGWGDGAANNAIGWGQGANNNIGWGDSHAKSNAGLTDIIGLTTDSDAQAFITAAAITDATQKSAIDTLVKGMKADGIWSKMKAIYPFVGGTATTHKWNLKDPRDLDAAFRLVFNGGWTHSANGSTPNGTNGYADTKLVPSSSLSTSSAHFAKYNRTNDLVGNKIDGAVQTQNASYIQHNYSAGNGIIGGVTTLAGYTQSNTLGLFTATRTSSSSMKVLKNNNVVSTNTTTTNILPSVNFHIGARNEDGTPFYYNTYQAAFVSIGDGLTDTEAANLYTRVQAFQTALSRQV